MGVQKLGVMDGSTVLTLVTVPWVDTYINTYSMAELKYEQLIKFYSCHNKSLEK